MLKPAILFKDEIETKMKEKFYSDDMMFETGGLYNWTPEIVNPCEDCSTMQYAITDNDNKLVGFIMFSIDWYSQSASRFGLMSFDKGNIHISMAIREVIRKLIKEYHLHRIEWRMVGGNPVERHYDYWCKKFNGTKFELHDVFKDRTGKYHNDYIYEIILED